MKTNPSFKIFKLHTLAATLAIVIACVISLRPAQAGYIVTLQQVGPNVVATGSGPLDLTGLSSQFGASGSGIIEPFEGAIRTGAFANFTVFHGAISGPTPPGTFGDGFPTFADSGTGDIVAGGFNLIQVPEGYMSNNPLSGSSTYLNATFSSLGVTPGTYVWTWGTGANQNFTLQIPTAGVPDSGSTLGLFLLSFAALFCATRFRAIRLA